ncbi:MAG: hypothetical protein KDL87_18720, partial [Verrucomicrobiae bacterium]|nr:hypothetical protein [Verrucomicrobiae bacterium]
MKTVPLVLSVSVFLALHGFAWLSLRGEEGTKKTPATTTTSKSAPTAMDVSDKAPAQPTEPLQKTDEEWRKQL